MAFDRLLDARHIGGGGAGEFQNRLVPCGGGFLRKKAEGDIFLEGDATFVGGGFAKNQGKEGGFTRTVWTDETDPVFAVNLERDITEESAACERFTDLGKGEHGEQIGRVIR